MAALAQACQKALASRWFNEKRPEESIRARDAEIRQLVSKCDTVISGGRASDLEISEALLLRDALREHLAKVRALKAEASVSKVVSVPLRNPSLNETWTKFCQTEPKFFLRKTLRTNPLARKDRRELQRLTVSHIARKTKNVPEPTRQAVMRTFLERVDELVGKE